MLLSSLSRFLILPTQNVVRRLCWPFFPEMIILCQITSRDIKDEFALKLRIQDFESGSLPLESNIRPNRLFTADSHIVLYKIGHLNKNKIIEIISKVIKIIST